jgi:radical SAM superfamily enzyme YgiQ (UPF0313 family)
MDALPWVADVYRRDLDIRRYNINFLQHPYISLSTGRGCPAEDADCLWPQTTGEHPYRVRSAQNVTDEVAYMKRLFPGVKEFFFEDDTFTSNVSRALEIAGRMGSLGITWSCRSRPNLEEKIIRKLENSGLRLFLVNYESGNEFILRQIRKGVTIEEMRRFTQICHRVGVRIHGTFILGLPIETPESIENTIRFAQELDIFSIQVSLAMPYPGTDLYELARQNGWLVRNNQDRWGLTNGDHRRDPLSTGLSKDEVFESIERFYHRYYLRPKPILRMLKTMLEDRGVFVQRCQNGVELIRSIGKHRKMRD